MPKLGVEFIVSETPQSGGISQSTGTMFLTGASNFGPEEPTRCRSLSEVEKLYAVLGREAANAKLYDAANAFFALGGQTAYVNRIHGAGSPEFASKEVETAGKTKALKVKARYKGTAGNKIQLTVLAESIVVTNEVSGEVLETIKIGAKLESTTYPKETSYVIVEEGSNYSTAKTEGLKTATIAAMSSGADPTNNETTTISTVEGFAKTLGPGQYVTAATEAFKEKVHEAMHLQAQKNNRFALCDIEGSETAATSAATLITNKKAGVTSGVQLGYGAYFSSACTALGLTIGTTRTIPSSAVVAGLFAEVASTGTDNRAPAGPRHSLAPFVTGFTNSYSETAASELNEAGINTMAERAGTLCLYGDVTACPNSKDLIFWQYSASRERMRLVWEGEQILEKYQFITLDGRHQKRAKMQGDLQSMCKRQWELESLYGETAAEAAKVVVGEPVNTPTTEQEGQLNAEILVRLSPVVQGLKGILVSVPITEAIL